VAALPGHRGVVQSAWPPILLPVPSLSNGCERCAEGNLYVAGRLARCCVEMDNWTAQLFIFTNQTAVLLAVRDGILRRWHCCHSLAAAGCDVDKGFAFQFTPSANSAQTLERFPTVGIGHLMTFTDAIQRQCRRHSTSMLRRQSDFGCVCGFPNEYRVENCGRRRLVSARSSSTRGARKSLEPPHVCSHSL